MIPITTQPKKLIALCLSSTEEKNGYPLRRALRIAEELSSEATIVFITDVPLPDIPTAYRTMEAATHRTLLQVVSFLKPDLLIRDTGSTVKDEVEAIWKLVPSILHFDDFGEGGHAADFVIQTLYGENAVDVTDQFKTGIRTFMPDPRCEELRAKRDLQTFGDPPRLLIAFGEKDPGNLTFRAFRHVMNLQIPLNVTILLGKSYEHDASTLQMMALSRRNTSVKKAPHDFLDLAAEADIVLCGGGYMPYDVASIGVPCIVLAQSSFESELQFPTDRDGFSHLGLGRKVKQSNLLNAIMEPLLHDSLRKRDIDRQLALPLGEEADTLFETARYLLDHPKRAVPGKPLRDVVN
ncbi:hypothetical protein PGH26_01320 [Sporosarcina jeotgali]|uniref:CMP-N-acetylneuraminic acid synthetase n=1 Tax=Sporosarcina jeotgali TaxID=3020056 RepID=A0ABZ0KX94_9BACL|nr:hypothetical protein [Sporosarcina sp. B2O-1]WOV84590.1 hypothetical protein PGH26_01320 [Sporosarcina sp. B2O-1]